MRTDFAEVLARESACLGVVTNGAMLASWKRRVVEELMTPRSPYALALHQVGDAHDRADFLDQWRELIANTVHRLLKTGATQRDPEGTAVASRANMDAQKMAVLILAALHGGNRLSQVARDPRPLHDALDLALVTLVSAGNGSPERGTSCPVTSIDL